MSMDPNDPKYSDTPNVDVRPLEDYWTRPRTFTAKQLADALDAEYMARLMDPPNWDENTDVWKARTIGIIAALESKP